MRVLILITLVTAACADQPVKTTPIGLTGVIAPQGELSPDPVCSYLAPSASDCCFAYCEDAPDLSTRCPLPHGVCAKIQCPLLAGGFEYPEICGN